MIKYKWCWKKSEKWQDEKLKKKQCLIKWRYMERSFINFSKLCGSRDQTKKSLWNEFEWISLIVNTGIL